jgi:hypothetical protein
VLDDPYRLPLDDESVDVVVNSSCLERPETFWLLFLEMLRILKPSSLVYSMCLRTAASIATRGLLAFPSGQHEGARDLGKAQRLRPAAAGVVHGQEGRNRQLLDDWSDFVAVLVKDAAALLAGRRIIDKYESFDNGCVHGSDSLLRGQHYPETTRAYFSLLDKMPSEPPR